MVEPSSRGPVLGGQITFNKTLANFDSASKLSIDRKQIQDLATLCFLAHGESAALSPEPVVLAVFPLVSPLPSTASAAPASFGRLVGSTGRSDFPPS